MPRNPTKLRSLSPEAAASGGGLGREGAKEACRYSVSHSAWFTNRDKLGGVSKYLIRPPNRYLLY